MVLPNFLIIGTPKAGTTAIYHYLNQHPEIYFSPEKEPHFFSFIGEQKPHWGVKTLAEYEKLFKAVTTEKAIGEASTWYLYSQSAAKQIRKYLPNVKLIIILRNPIERAYSSWAFRVQCGWESIIDFEQALQAEENRISNNYEWDFHYLKTGFYYHQIQRYFNLFSKEQIFICTYDELKDDSPSLIQDIFNFLEVDNSFIPDTSIRHNQTQLPKNKIFNRFLTKSSCWKNIIKIFVPDNIRKKLQNKITITNQTSVPKLSQKIKTKYTSLYEEDILKTSELSSIDVSQWLNFENI